MERLGSIITFYSYKGGVGRSMAVANVAWIVAKEYHKKVLVVDWDLEAPGLHKYFSKFAPGLEKERGLIDYIDDHKKSFEQPSIDSQLNEYRKKLDKRNLSYEEYAIRVEARERELLSKWKKKDIPEIDHTHFPEVKEFEEGGRVSILTAGRQDVNYIKRVNKHNWIEFYQNYDGYNFIENLKQKFKQHFDLVIIDSRTGVTDAGGVCTLQLPDRVTLFFALNKQNIEGTARIAERIKTNAANTKSQQPPLLFAEPTRVEFNSEQVLLSRWIEEAVEKLRGYLNPESAETSTDEKDKFIRENAIPYLPFYNFGEDIAAEVQPNDALSRSYRRLAKRTLSSFWTLVEEKQTQRKKIGERIKEAIARRKLNLNLLKFQVQWSKILLTALFASYLYFSEEKQDSFESIEWLKKMFYAILFYGILDASFLTLRGVQFFRDIQFGLRPKIQTNLIYLIGPFVFLFSLIYVVGYHFSGLNSSKMNFDRLIIDKGSVERKNGRLEFDYSKLEDKYYLLDSIVGVRRDSVVMLVDSILSLNEELNIVYDAVNKDRLKVKDLSNEMAKLRLKYSSINSKYREQTAENNEFRDSLSELNSEIRTKKEDLEKALKSITTLQNELDSIGRELSSNLRSLRSLQEDKRFLEKELDSKSTALTAARSEIRNLKLDNSSLSRDTTLLNRKVSDLLDEHLNLRNEINSLMDSLRSPK